MDNDAIKAMIKPLRTRPKELKKNCLEGLSLNLCLSHSNCRSGSHAWQAPEPAKPLI